MTVDLSLPGRFDVDGFASAERCIENIHTQTETPEDRRNRKIGGL
jgi:hypothetical protein